MSQDTATVESAKAFLDRMRGEPGQVAAREALAQAVDILYSSNTTGIKAKEIRALAFWVGYAHGALDTRP